MQPSALSAPAPHALRDSPAEAARGILVVIAAYILMTLGDVAGKWALLPAGLAAVMVGRGMFGCAAVAGLALAEGGLRRLRPVRWRPVLVRSVLHSFVSITWYLAWQVIPLADAYAISFTAPLLMTVLAVPMLGERLRWRRTLSTLVGFGGVLVMVRPGSSLWTPALLVMAPGLVAMAVTRIMTRQLSTTETPECIAFWLLAAHIPAGLVMVALGWPGLHLVAPGILLALALLGAFNGGAHWMMARAYALAPVSALAPYEYTLLIWGGLAGWLVFAEVPAPGTLAGAAIVAAAGLYNLHRERRLRRCS